MEENYLNDDYQDYPDEEPSYGLCDSCWSNDHEGMCSKYCMPLEMVKRKKKCKYYFEYPKCRKCKNNMELFTDVVKIGDGPYDFDSWEILICLYCGNPLKFGSIKHRKRCLEKIIEYRFYVADPNAHSSCQQLIRSKRYLPELKEFINCYLKASRNKKTKMKDKN